MCECMFNIFRKRKSQNFPLIFTHATKENNIWPIFESDICSTRLWTRGSDPPCDRHFDLLQKRACERPQDACYVAANHRHHEIGQLYIISNTAPKPVCTTFWESDVIHRRTNLKRWHFWIDGIDSHMYLICRTSFLLFSVDSFCANSLPNALGEVEALDYVEVHCHCSMHATVSERLWYEHWIYTWTSSECEKDRREFHLNTCLNTCHNPHTAHRT